MFFYLILKVTRENAFGQKLKEKNEEEKYANKSLLYSIEVLLVVFKYLENFGLLLFIIFS